MKKFFILLVLLIPFSFLQADMPDYPGDDDDPSPCETYEPDCDRVP